ncbi:MAG TPA: isochorismatase family cysteine hydrolase [Bauldia sp.]|nr:isochorismatase family cysteine hydrolase [Bauldia sp.]
MAKPTTVAPAHLTDRTVHLCVDMQRLFAPGGPWPTPWMERVLPAMTAIATAHAARTVFTRFIPPEKPEHMPGAWRDYYRRWREVTGEHLDPEMLELVPPLAALVPPAVVIDKPVYSAFHGDRLRRLLSERGADALVVTGGETDVCVLATVLGAVDSGYRVLLVTDAVCSSSDAGHDALMTLFSTRFSLQVELTTAEALLSAWTG